MTAACPAIDGSAGLAERLAAYVECQSAQIDLAAFQGGLWHGLPAALVTVLMVLYVAGFGYRLILRRRMDVAELVYAAVRLGVVIALATTLSAYSSLVYTVATQGPEELAAMALAPAGLRAPSPVEASRAAAEDLASAAGPAQNAPSSMTPATPAAGGDPSARPPTPLPTAPTADLGDAVFILSCGGFGLAARLAQSIILAAGPLFIAAALFDVSADLCVGWVRAQVALFVAQAGYAVSSALELSFFGQELERPSQAAIGAGEPLMVGLFFMAAGVGVTVVAVLAAGGLVRSSLARRNHMPEAPRPIFEASSSARSPWLADGSRPDHAVSRAQSVTDAVGALVAAEQRQNGGRVIAGGTRATESTATSPFPTGAGPGLRRPGQLRASTSAARRDSIS